MLRKFRHLLAPLALAAALLLPSPNAAQALSTGCLPTLDYTTADSHFFAQAGSNTGLGFYVRDDADARFLTAFRSGGGVHALGYPTSRRYLESGFIYQAFQKAILQWPIGADHANYANTVDWLGRIGADTELHVKRQIPFYVPLAADRGLDPTDPDDFAHIVQNHLQILAVDDEIRQFFLSEPRWLELYGLPVSYQDFGPVRVLRSQRQIIQVWNVPDIGGPVGKAVLANTGDIAKEFGLLPSAAVVPMSPPVRSGDRISASATPAIAGSPTLVEIAGTSSQIRATGHRAVSYCIGKLQHLLVPVPLDQEAGPVTLEFETIGAGPKVTGSVEIEVEELTAQAYELIGVSGDLETLFDPEVEAADKLLLEEITTPISLQQLFDEPFQAPLPGEITSGFGDRRSVDQREDPLLHLGVDYAGDLDEPVLAPAGGIVTAALDLAVYGRTLVIDHGLGIYSIFAHLSEFERQPGDRVAPGDVIGTVGSTGRSTGPHLHWEVYVFGTPVDARAFIDSAAGQFGVPLRDHAISDPSDEPDPMPPDAVG